jgi:DNA polymerase-1
MNELMAFWRWMGERHDGVVCFDTESAGLAWWRNKHRMTQIGDMRAGWAFPPEWMGAAHEALQTWMAAGNRAGAWNAPYDWLVLGHHHGLWLNWAQIEDAQLASHLADSAPPGMHPSKALALKPRAAHDIDPTAMAWQGELDEAMKAQKWTYATVPGDFPPFWRYGAGDPVLTAHLLARHLPEVRGSFGAAYDLELAYARICAQMMHAGMMIDRPYITHWEDQMQAWVAQALAWLKAEHGVTSVESGEQVGAALERAGVFIERRTPRTGRPQIDKETMEHYAATYPQAAGLISTLRWARKAQAVLGRHFGKFLAMADENDVIHYAIHSVGAAHTSRQSVTEPALQTLDRDFPQIRGSFRPRPGHVFVAWDADQIEMRMAAHFSGDRQLIADFAACDASGTSFFVNLAGQIYREEISKRDPRYTMTKNTSYATIYGSGLDTAAATAGVSVTDLEPIYEGFKARYRTLSRDSFRLVQSQKRRGHRPQVTTLWGRRLYADKAYALIDYRIQGSSAEFLKAGALNMDAAGIGQYLRLPIHDELLAEVPADQAEEILRAGAEILTDRTRYRVPLTWSGTTMPIRWTK